MNSRLGVYEVLGTLGEGGMGLVYRVRHLQLGGEYALKTIPLDSDPDALLRTRREGEAMAQLSGHPNVVSVHSLFEDQGQLCLVMELCPGGDLQTRLEQGPLPAAAAVQILAGLAEGLAAAHAAGILHRDLKPANVLFDAGGLPKLTDFGIARVADSQSLTQTGSLLGTPSYMAPEQAEGRRADARSDVYGLGAILYQCLSGAPPFGPGPVLSVLHSVVNAPPPPLPPGVPAELAALCLRALAKDPAGRPQSALEFKRELEPEPDASLVAALRIASAVLGIVILALVGFLGSRALAKARARAESPPPSSSSPPLAVESPRGTRSPTPGVRPVATLAPAEEHPWSLKIGDWPSEFGPRRVSAEQVREISRRAARFPTLAPAAWRARGLRTHARPPPSEPTDLGDLPGPEREFFARAFQDLEAHPDSLSCLRAASRGLELSSIRRAAGVRGHPSLGLWLGVRSLGCGSGEGLNRLRSAFLFQGLKEELEACAIIQTNWKQPVDVEIQAAWERVGRFAQERFAKPERVLSEPDGDHPADPLAAQRVLAELATRSWDLLLLLEAGAREEGAEEFLLTPSARLAGTVIGLGGGACRGELAEVRSLGSRLLGGDSGLLRDRVTGRLLLLLAATEWPSQAAHAYYNLGHGTAVDALKRAYSERELACLVLARGFGKTRMSLRRYSETSNPLPLPSREEAELIFLELRAEELDAAGLLGRPPTAYGEPPGLPSGAPFDPASIGPGRQLSVHLRAWLPHSLMLRAVAREAAQLPGSIPEARREVAKGLALADPLRAALLLRGALEGDRFAGRRFIDLLPELPVSDPVLRVRLQLAAAFFGQPRVLSGFTKSLEDLGPEWAERVKAAKPAAERVRWESKDLAELREAKITSDAAPGLEESWRVLRALDADLASQPVLTRLSSWNAEPFLPGSHSERVARGLERLAARRPRVARALRAARSLPESEATPEQRLLREADQGSPQALLGLAKHWAKRERFAVARAVFQFALEALPRTAWLDAAPIAKALWLPDLAKALRSLSQAPTPELWQVFHRERELALMGAGLPSLADLDAWGVPRR